MAAEAAISSLVELLGDQLIQKVKSLRGVKGQVELLKDELKRMQSFLNDANKKQAKDERVRTWISEIREVALDAEDTLQMFHLNVENPRSMGLLKRGTSFPKRMYHLQGIGDEIKSIRDRLDAIDRSRERYGIKDLGESASRLQVESRRRLCPWQKDEHVVGVEDDVKKLLQESILCEEKQGLSIAAVEGMGGIGKSTLARKIYNHPDVMDDRFDHCGWVVVSSEFTALETIKQLIFQLSKQDNENLLDQIKRLEESMKDKLFLQEELNGMLHKQLVGKSYFIVLDDVWETEHLESLITAFPNEHDKASRLLVTTRNKIITKIDQYMHKMKLLDLEKGWELLLKKTLISGCSGKCPEELESVGRQILEKCRGLPLAINVVGGLLMETQTKSGWQQVLHQMNSYLERSESSVSSILELSYQNLSPQLKSCFLCLAFFKEDFTIPAKRVLKLWDAQGLIQQEGSRTIDEIGRGYLNELINRSMLQIQELTLDDQVSNCRLHDLLREVCLRKAKEEIGLEIVRVEEGISSYKTRHRVVYGNIIETSSLNQNKHIRSLFLHNDSINLYSTIPSLDWKSYQLLKTLEIENFRIERWPKSFKLLIGLKCLRIHTYHLPYGLPMDLPSWFDHLISLEVLDMEGVDVLLPRHSPLKMDKLRYFHALFIDCSVTRIHIWKNMESLKYISHNDWMKRKSTATNGCCLRKLGIYFTVPIEPEELIKLGESLEKLQNLAILHLRSNGPQLDIALAMPRLTNLTKLKLKRAICPAASMFPPHLSHLNLLYSNIHDDPMAELGKLPKLSFLKIHNSGHAGETMHVLCDGFPCLEALTLLYFNKLKVIFVEQGGMPQLKHLRIRKCPYLDTGNFPEHINISVG